MASAFPQNQVREWASTRGLLASQRLDKAPKGAGAPRGPKAVNTGMVRLEVINPTGKGVPARVYQGQTLPRFVPGAFKALLGIASDNFETES